MEPLTTIAMTQPLTLGKLPVFKTRLDKLLDNMDQLYSVFQRQIDEHQRHITPERLGEESMDFCEAFLKEMHIRGGQDETQHSFSINQLRNMCLDLWTAGLETTTNTVAFAILYYIRHPRAQYLVKKELERVIDSDRLISVEDKNNLPYLNAFISVSLTVRNASKVKTFYSSI